MAPVNGGKECDTITLPKYWPIYAAGRWQGEKAEAAAGACALSGCAHARHQHELEQCEAEEADDS